ncbi:MAG: hypothetical protein KKA81_10775 [Bacteroidetes bacterium]|nr:hypothetical protein [Bacteroidota bacterium]
MRKGLAIGIALSFLVINVFTQNFQEFLDYLNTIPGRERASAVDSFMVSAGSQGFPFITGDTATFIYFGKAKSVQIAGDFNNWDPSVSDMQAVRNTGLWHYSAVFPMKARLDYKLVINKKEWILDSLNPFTCTGGYGTNSELSMPAYVQPWEVLEYEDVPKGSILTFNVNSSFFDDTHQIQVYLPPGYQKEQGARYPVAYFTDDYEYLDLGFTKNVIDNLIDSNLICPVIAVFIRPVNRDEEYAGMMIDAFQSFYIRELVPWIDREFNTLDKPRARAIIGASYGGNISALISFNFSDVIGKCGLHSAAFWPDDYKVFHIIAPGEKKEVTWASFWGLYEGVSANLRDFRDSLLVKEYDLKWQELPEGHSWGLWRATTGPMLQYFFPPDFMEIP